MSARRFVGWHKEERIGVVTLDRPEALNALSGGMADELSDAFREAAADEDVWVVLLEAAGDRAFCVGADLKERAAFSLDDFRANRRHIHGMFESLRAVPQPTIAVIFGHALGGGFELALSCDFIAAAEGTMVGLPEARVGLLAAGGGTQLLTRKAGVTRAKELILTGRRISAEEANELGMVSRLEERSELAGGARSLAGEIIASSPVAVRAAKRSIDAALGVPLEDGVALEDEAWAEVIASDDRAEGIAAFNEKRAPAWKNR